MFCTVSDMRPPRPLQSLGQGVSGEVLPAEADKSPSHLIYQAGQMYPADEGLQHVFGIMPPGGLYCISSARLDSFFKETRSPVNSRPLSARKADSEPLCSEPHTPAGRDRGIMPLLPYCPMDCGAVSRCRQPNGPLLESVDQLSQAHCVAVHK